MNKKRTLNSILVAVLSLSLIAAGPQLASAADGDRTVTVSTGAELDQAIRDAVSGTTTITLVSDIDAVSSATYAGYATGTTIIINGQGHTVNGGGVQDTGLRFGGRNVSLNLVVNDTAFANMTNDDSHGGGAIAVWRGNLSVSGSTFTGNNANNSAARGNGGAVQLENANGFLDIVNSTFVGNVASAAGGAVNTAAPGSIVNSTFASNGAASGAGGINIRTAGAVTVANSIAVGNGEVDIAGAADGGNNIVGYFSGAGDTTVTGVDIGSASSWLAAEVSSTDGATPTLALLETPDSPAVDKANAALAPAIDQRGVARDETPDIGAYELVKSTTEPGMSYVDLRPTGSAFGRLSFDLCGVFTSQRINLIEFTMKFDASKLDAIAVVPLENMAIVRADVDSGKGLVRIVAGVTNDGAIANGGYETLAKVTITPKVGLKPDAAYISISSGAIYSAGIVAEYGAVNSAAYARFVYRNGLDVNGDGVVNSADLSLALYYFGSASIDENWDVTGSADLNGDGVVDMLDITMLVDALYT
jgi:hypothetical protein